MTTAHDTTLTAILAASRPEELFGDAPDRAAVRRAYRRLARAVHPDTAPADDRTQAGFARLAALYARAGELLAGGAYGAAPSPVTITGRHHAYRLGGELARGDSSVLYRVRYDGCAPGGERDGIVKLVRDPRDNDLAANEAATLARLLGNVATFDVLSPYLPAYIESLALRDPDHRTPRRALAFAAAPGAGELLSLAQIRARRPGGLPAQDGAWMLRRILVALALVHANGVVHGALTPDHVLVAPAQRGIVLVDWKYAVDVGASVAAAPALWREMLAPEIGAGRPAGPGADIFMAMRCIAYVLGGDPATGAVPGSVERHVAGFLRGASHANPRRRPHDALALKGEFDELIDELWGERRFAPLVL
jgi:hypothetical protein